MKILFENDNGALEATSHRLYSQDLNYICIFEHTPTGGLHYNYAATAFKITHRSGNAYSHTRLYKYSRERGWILIADTTDFIGEGVHVNYSTSPAIKKGIIENIKEYSIQIINALAI